MPDSSLPTDEPVFLTTGQFSRRVGLSTSTVKRLCEAGTIASVVISNRGDRRIPTSELERLRSLAEASRDNRGR